VRHRDVRDGHSNTYSLGEKYLNPDHYLDGEDKADDQCIFIGHDADVNGYTANGPDGDLPPLRDRPGLGDNRYNFGSAHPGVFHMAFCDGSVRAVQYDIDTAIHRLMGGRNDE